MKTYIITDFLSGEKRECKNLSIRNKMSIAKMYQLGANKFLNKHKLFVMFEAGKIIETGCKYLNKTI